jgi:hypothetical protein
MKNEIRYCNIVRREVEMSIFDFPTTDSVMPILSYEGKFIMCRAYSYCLKKQQDCIFTGEGKNDPFM